MSLFKGENSIGKLLTYTQEELYEMVANIAIPKLKGDGFIILGRGNKPKPMLCVHLDTINTSYKERVFPQHIDFHYNNGNPYVALASNSKVHCLGGDDRAGVWIALQMVEHMRTLLEWEYDIGLFTDEEVGAIGSTNYYEYIREHTVHNINTTCYIGLDRRSTGGRDEVATYGKDNTKLINKFVQGYNYLEVTGTFTDASNLAQEVACINLSVGYDKEHSKQEVLYTKAMERTLEVLKGIVWDDEMYYEIEENYSDYYSYLYKDDPDYNINYEYVELLEEENKILRDALAIYGVDIEGLLREEMYYDYK